MRRSLVLAIAPALWLEAAQGQEAAPGPDLDFLEYLGSWDEGEDEWLDVEEWRRAEADGNRRGSRRERQRDDDDESE
jgi:hypothetical protein